MASGQHSLAFQKHETANRMHLHNKDSSWPYIKDPDYT